MSVYGVAGRQETTVRLPRIRHAASTTCTRVGRLALSSAFVATVVLTTGEATRQHHLPSYPQWLTWPLVTAVVFLAGGWLTALVVGTISRRADTLEAEVRVLTYQLASVERVTRAGAAGKAEAGHGGAPAPDAGEPAADELRTLRRRADAQARQLRQTLDQIQRMRADGTPSRRRRRFQIITGGAAVTTLSRLRTGGGATR